MEIRQRPQTEAYLATLTKKLHYEFSAWTALLLIGAPECTTRLVRGAYLYFTKRAEEIQLPRPKKLVWGDGQFGAMAEELLRMGKR